MRKLYRFSSNNASANSKGVSENMIRLTFYKHLKGMDVEGKRTFISQYIKDEDSRLLQDDAPIQERWVRRFHHCLTPCRRPLTRSL